MQRLQAPRKSWLHPAAAPPLLPAGTAAPAAAAQRGGELALKGLLLTSCHPKLPLQGACCSHPFPAQLPCCQQRPSAQRQGLACCALQGCACRLIACLMGLTLSARQPGCSRGWAGPAEGGGSACLGGQGRGRALAAGACGARAATASLPATAVTSCCAAGARMHSCMLDGGAGGAGVVRPAAAAGSRESRPSLKL